MVRIREPLYRFVAIRVGEYFREAAVLIPVFAVLDKVILGYRIPFLYGLEVMTISIGFLVFGIALERRFGGK